MKYRIGWPMWRTVARLGGKLYFRVNVLHDVEAQVYVATSPDVRGLVVEAPDVHALMSEVRGAACGLLGAEKSAPASPRVDFDNTLCAA